MIVRPCEHCGNSFDAESSNAKAKRQGKLNRFCSRRCRNLSRPTRPEHPPEYFQRPCGLCGNIFDATPSRPQYDRLRKYCRGCVRAGRKAKIQKLHAHRKTNITCKHCGNMFVLAARLIKSGKHSGQYCSIACVYADRKGKSKPFNHPSEVGSRRINAQGYIEIKVAASGREDYWGWVKEHRHVMEQIIGRPLLPTESVHHKDGNRAHNDPSNLELWIKPQPTGIRAADLIAYVVEYHREALLTALSHRPL